MPVCKVTACFEGCARAEEVINIEVPDGATEEESEAFKDYAVQQWAANHFSVS